MPALKFTDISRLTLLLTKDTEEIKLHFAAGKTLAELAGKYGTTPTQLKNLLIGLSIPHERATKKSKEEATGTELALRAIAIGEACAVVLRRLCDKLGGDSHELTQYLPPRE